MWKAPWLVCLLFLAAAGYAAAESPEAMVDVPITRDTFVNQFESVPRCTSGILCIGNQPNFNEYVLVAFDLPPAPACNQDEFVCSEATLRLYTVGEPDDQIEIEAHRISPNFQWADDATACNGHCPTRDCPPIYRAYVLDTRFMNPQPDEWVEFDISYAVSCWYNNPTITNQGIALIPLGAATQNGCFKSKDSTS